MHKKKPRNIYVLIIRLIAVLALCIIIYKYFYSEIKLSLLIESLKKANRLETYISLLFAILLMPLNWFFESQKWRFSLAKTIELTPKSAFIKILQGVSFGIVTPGRVGEYGGRVAYLPSNQRLNGALATFFCSLAQNIVNIVFAILSAIIILSQIKDIIINPALTLLGTLGLLILLLGCYFWIGNIMNYLQKLPWMHQYKFLRKSLDFTDLWDIKDKYHILIFSVWRYVIYVLQYYLVLRAFAVDVGTINLLLSIAVIFGFQTLLPLTPILQFAIRGTIALNIIGSYSTMTEEILISSYTMWFLNLLIPAVIGIWYFLIKERV